MVIFVTTRAGVRLLLFFCLALVIVLLLPAPKPLEYTQAQAQTAGPAVEVITWTKPESGWLYVLDSTGGRGASQILLIDPNQERVMGAIRAGYDPREMQIQWQLIRELLG